MLDVAISQLDNNLVMNAGNLTEEERAKVTEEMNTYKKYKMDVCFILHNLYKHQNNYVLALDFCKEHSQINREIYKANSKFYAYALLLEALCMCKIEHLDKREALEILDQALQIQLNLNKGNIVEAFLGRLYEEKGHILKMMADQAESQRDEELLVVYSTRALQCFNSAHAILAQFRDQLPRLEYVAKTVKELSKDKRVTRKLQVVGKFSTDFLDETAAQNLDKMFAKSTASAASSTDP